MASSPVLIIGAGISGLTLAQYLRKNGIPFRIFERDVSLSSRAGGWGVTIGWARSQFGDLLPGNIIEKLEESHVQTDAVKTGNYGRFTLFDLSTGIAKFNVPAARRMRFSRTRLREILATDIQVEWSKRLKDIKTCDTHVTAEFEDGSSATGCLAVGCDGSRSRVRQMVYPHSYQNRPIPITMLGVTLRYSTAQTERIRAIDPYFFHGTHGKSNVYMFFSFLEPAPDPKEDATKTSCLCQVTLSWPYANDQMVPLDNKGRVDLMKDIASDFVEPFRSLVEGIPQTADVVSINMEDWVPGSGGCGQGRILLVGDAAHTMTMFRGEGANQAVADVNEFAMRFDRMLVRLAQADLDEALSLSEISTLTQEYEEALFNRGAAAVMESRKACFHAHELDAVDEESPLVARRLQDASHRPEL